MAENSTYTPPKVWQWDKESGGRFAKINRPIAGATHDKELPVGEHDLQLYSLATPNGVKVTVLLEELLDLGIKEAEYDAYLVDISEGEQFGSGFVAINPNSKIPALLDRSTTPPTRVFESGAMLVYLAEKFGAFLPTEPSARAECLSWLFFQMGSAPYIGGGFGHFYAYAPEKFEYPINRFRHGDETPPRCVEPPSQRPAVFMWRRVHHRGHRELRLVRCLSRTEYLRSRRVS